MWQSFKTIPNLIPLPVSSCRNNIDQNLEFLESLGGTAKKTSACLPHIFTHWILFLLILCPGATLLDRVFS